VYPVLALADGVGLAVGAMTWGRSLCIGLLADETLVPDLDQLAGEIKRSFEASQRAAGLPAPAGPRQVGQDGAGRRPHPGKARRAGRLVPAGRRPR
jgi:hypothetical protein